MLGRANRMFRIDNGRFAAGTLPTSCSPGCPNPMPAAPTACALLQCGYIPSIEFTGRGYDYSVVAAASQTCDLGQRSGEKTSTDAYLACAKRCSGSSPCTSSSKYAAWGYAVDTANVVHSFGAANFFPPEH
jgi:hypothetical protein